MALKTKADLETLDIVYLGQPFVQVATTAIVATNLDTVYQAQPFYAVDPAGGVVEEGAAALSSAATVAVTAQVNRDLDAVLSAEATATVAGKRIRNAEATLASATDVTTAINYITDNDVYAQAEFQFTADGTVNRDYDVFTSAEATIEISGQVIKDLDVAMSSDTNVTVAGVIVKDFDVYIQAEAQFTVDGTVIKNFSATLEEAVSFSVQGQRNADIDLVAFSESAVTTAFTRIRNGEIAAVESFTQFTADGVRTLDIDAVLTSQSQFFADISRTRLGEATPSSAATLDIPVFSRLRPIRRAPKTLTAAGGAALSTTQEKFGVSSLYLDGANDRVNVSSSPDFAFGTGDFTIEMWIRPVDNTNVVLLENRSTGTSDTNGWVLYLNTSQQIVFARGTTVVINSAQATQPNQWQHIVVVRNSGRFRIYRNGFFVATGTPATVNFTNTNLIIGEGVSGTTFGDYDGYIDELRITKGLARYLTNFTVATEEFRNDANTVLLAHFNGANESTTFVDAAGDYLDAASAVTVNIGVKKPLSADLASSATLTAAANYTVSADVFTEANATLTSTPGFIFDVPVDLEASAGTLTAAAKIGTFLVDLNASSTLTADISVISPIEVNMSSQASMSTNAGKLIDFTVGQLLNSVAFTNNLTGTVTSGNISSMADRAESYLISFWANNADGMILATGGQDTSAERFEISFNKALNQFQVYQRTDQANAANDNRTITWTVDSTGWHHYVLYQEYSIVLSTTLPNTTNMRLIVDGAQRPVASIVNNDTTTSIDSAINDSIFLRNGYLESAFRWRVYPTNTDLYQLTVWFDDNSSTYNNAVPDAFSVIEQLYSPDGPLDLGPDGTGTGLRLADFYLGLTDYTETQDTGRIEGTVTWTKNGSAYTPSIADNATPYNFPIAGIFDVAADAQIIQSASANLVSTSSVTATAKKAVTLAANVSSQVTTDIAALRTKQLAANILAEGFAVTAAAKIADFFVPMQSQASFAVDGVLNAISDIAINSDTDLLADANVAFVGQATLNNETTLTVSGDVLITASADLNAQASLSAEFDRLILVSADLQSATDLLAQTVGNVTGSANLNVVFTQTATAKKAAKGNANLTTQATFAATVDRIVRFSADIQSNGFILVAGEVLQLDPELTYVIEQETRTLVITGEDRQYIIEEESRVYIISEETREYAVEPNTAVNII